MRKRIDGEVSRLDRETEGEVVWRRAPSWAWAVIDDYMNECFAHSEHGKAWMAMMDATEDEREGDLPPQPRPDILDELNDYPFRFDAENIVRLRVGVGRETPAMVAEVVRYLKDRHVFYDIRVEEGTIVLSCNLTLTSTSVADLEEWVPKAFRVARACLDQEAKSEDSE